MWASRDFKAVGAFFCNVSRVGVSAVRAVGAINMTNLKCNINPIHPGRILRRELEARELSANRLAIELKLPSGRITDILGGKRGISADTALRLGQFFGNSARFWLNLQTAYELAVAEPRGRSANSRGDQASTGGGAIASVLDVALRE